MASPHSISLYLTPSAIEALGDRTSGNRDRSAVASRMLEALDL